LSRYHSYLNSAKTILAIYKGEEPFSSYLKKKFAENKKYGSKDRKQISHLCYCFFRLGKMAMNIPAEERIMAGLFLCSDRSNDILENIRPEWNEKVSLSIEKKIALLGPSFLLADVFPWKESIGDEIDYQKFSESFLVQPDLFIRLRPGKEDKVLQQLNDNNIPFKAIGKTCIAFPNATKIDEVVEADKEAVIQDYKSQQTLEAVKEELVKLNKSFSVWDSCAASGGKSILAKDILPDFDLTVSDIRESILSNLEKRFARAGIIRYKSFVADLSKPFTGNNYGPFDLVIADVPCSGSGTWGRTPEQICYFDESMIDKYASLQKKIISNVIPYIKPGGFLLYITCSVFKKENEEAVAFVKEQFNFEVMTQKLLAGYDMKADTLFTALLKKQS